MTKDNFNGPTLTVLECRALKLHFDESRLISATWHKKALASVERKVEQGASIPLPGETDGK